MPDGIGPVWFVITFGFNPTWFVITRYGGDKYVTLFGGRAGGHGVSFYMYIAVKDFLIVFITMQKSPYRAGEYRLAIHVRDWTDKALSEALCGSQDYTASKG